MSSNMAPQRNVTTERTKKDKKIEENWPYYGLLSFIKKEGTKILSSGAIVEFRSPYFPDCTRFLLISDKFLDPDACGSMHDYYFVLPKTNGGSLKTVELSYVAKPKTTKLFRPTPGVIFIPIYPPAMPSFLINKKLNSIFSYRAISSSYYNRKRDDIPVHCFIPGIDETKSDPFTVEQFELIIRYNGSKLNKEHMEQYELQSACGGNVYRTFTEIKKDFLHLYPHGAMVASLKARKAIGILNFTDDGRISPIFFTHENLTLFTGELCLFYPISGAIENTENDCRTKVVSRKAVTEDKASMQMLPQEEVEKHLLNNALDTHRLQIRPHIKIPADGNCLFHALADQLRQPGHIYKSLRELAVKELQDNSVNKHLPLDLEKFLINKDVETYLQEMSCDKVWGGDPELVALSYGLSRTIQVVTAAENPDEAIRQFANFDGSPILLGFAGHHYYSLEPMQPSCDGLSHDNDDGNQVSTCMSKSIAEVSRTKQHLAPKPEASEKHPTTNYDEQPVCIDGIHCRADCKEDWLNTRCLLTILREKRNECNKQRHQIESDQQEKSRLRQQNSELKFTLMAVQEENRALREELERYKNREGSVEDSSSTGIKAEELSVASTSNSKRASDVSSEDEPFIDALNHSL